MIGFTTLPSLVAPGKQGPADIYIYIYDNRFKPLCKAMKLRQSKLKLGITKSPESTFLKNTWSRKRNGRVNGSPNNNSSKLAAPEGKRKKSGSANGGSSQNTGPGRKTEEKPKGKRKKVISAQKENIVVFL